MNSSKSEEELIENHYKHLKDNLTKISHFFKLNLNNSGEE